jgi:ferritin
MLSTEMENALNEQINAEDYSSYLYESMANYFEHFGLKGFANWFKVQAAEEHAHARKIVDFVNDRGGRVLLKTIEGPKTEWKNAVEVFEDVVAHEEHVTKLINGLSTKAAKESDHATHTFLEWFIIEQVEEEASANDALTRVKMADGAPGAMLFLDQEFGQRGGAASAAS